jgi:hypothetical protein
LCRARSREEYENEQKHSEGKRLHYGLPAEISQQGSDSQSLGRCASGYASPRRDVNLQKLLTRRDPSIGICAKEGWTVMIVEDGAGYGLFRLKSLQFREALRQMHERLPSIKRDGSSLSALLELTHTTRHTTGSLERWLCSECREARWYDDTVNSSCDSRHGIAIAVVLLFARTPSAQQQALRISILVLRSLPQDNL